MVNYVRGLIDEEGDAEDSEKNLKENAQLLIPITDSLVDTISILF